MKGTNENLNNNTKSTDTVENQKSEREIVLVLPSNLNGRETPGRYIYKDTGEEVQPLLGHGSEDDISRVKKPITRQSEKLSSASDDKKGKEKEQQSHYVKKEHKRAKEQQTVWEAEDRNTYSDSYDSSEDEEQKPTKRGKDKRSFEVFERYGSKVKRSPESLPRRHNTSEKNPYESDDEDDPHKQRDNSREKLILEEEGSGLSLKLHDVSERVQLLIDDEDKKNLFEDIAGLRGKITMLELTGLKILTLVANGDEDIANHKGSKQIMDDFLFAAIGNMRLNNFIKKNRQLLIEEDISNDALDLMHSYTYGTRNMAKINQMLPDSNEDLNEQTLKDYFKTNKLTPKQFGLLMDYFKALKVFKPLFEQKLFIEKDLSNKDLSIKNIFYTASIIELLEQHLNSLSNQDFFQQVAPMLLFEDGKTRFDVKGDDRIGQKFVNSFVKYRHTGELVDAYNSTAFSFEKRVSHLPREFRLDAIDLKSLVYADMYKFDITALIDESKIPEGCDKDEWKDNISKTFKNVTDKFYTSDCTPFPHVRSQSKILEFLGFLASILPFGYRKIWGKNDFADIHQKMSTTYYDGTDSATMLCSEFTAKCLIASIVELNKLINTTLNNLNSVNEVDVNNMIWYVKVPFSEKEALDRMLPDRMHKVLNDKGCLIKIEPQFVADYINQDSYVNRIEREQEDQQEIMPPI